MGQMHIFDRTSAKFKRKQHKMNKLVEFIFCNYGFSLWFSLPTAYVLLTNFRLSFFFNFIAFFYKENATGEEKFAIQRD